MKKKSNITESEFKSFCEKYRQEKLLAHFSLLAGEKKRLFLRNLEGIDLETPLLEQRRFAGGQVKEKVRLEAGPVIPLGKGAKRQEEGDAARKRGEAMLSSGRVAVLVVAGGQGTRLGFKGPKGAFPVSPVRGKPLFRLIVEQVSARAEKAGKRIPLVFMTSPGNRRETEDFFSRHACWGFPPGDLFFFEQGLLPAVTPGGELLLSSETSLSLGPDGHGGMIDALCGSRIPETLSERGIEDIFYCQVDNPLVRVADPEFLGFHAMAGAEFSLKVLRRRDEKEKVGLYGLVDGRPAVVEYSDLPAEVMGEKDENGALKHWAGSIAIHVMKLSFLERIYLSGGADLPWHRAIKKVKAWKPGLGEEEVTGWKFEKFIFDAIPLARQVCCVETGRDEFAPVKNRTGLDSPGSTGRAMSDLHREWLEAAGHRVCPGCAVEISPLLAPDRETALEVMSRLETIPPPEEGGLYLPGGKE